jgi:hypothetical protein
VPVAYYLSPYEARSVAAGVGRRVAFDAATADIQAAGGDWTESEIDGGGNKGNVALVRVRADAATLANLATTWQVVADPTLPWTGTRKVPRSAAGEVAWDGGRTAPCRPLAGMLVDVPDDAGLVLRQKLVDALIAKAAKDGYARLSGLPWDEAARVLAACAKAGFPLDRVSTGTFPTTGLLDDFNRANNASLGANWSTLDTYASLGITSNACQPNASSGSGAYWNVATFGPDSENYVTVAAIGGSSQFFDQYVRVGTPGGNYNAYAHECTTNAGALYRVDAKVYTQLGAGLTITVAAGNIIGLEVIGSTLTLYKNAGSWASNASRTDSTYSAAGNIALFADNTGIHFDDFSGGTVVGGGAAQIPYDLKHSPGFQPILAM